MARQDTLKPLRDRVRVPMRALFVGINPGIRSAQTGHHFAGYSNRFWNLLFESGLVPERIHARDDARLPEWGYGVTNLIPRPTPGIDALRVDEFIAGARTLRRKIRRWRPPVVALVGVTLYRALFPDLRQRQKRLRPSRAEPPSRLALRRAGGPSLRRSPGLARTLRRSSGLARTEARGPASVKEKTIGLQDLWLEGARVFVLPNPSGRNANYSYAEMLASFRQLRRFLKRRARAGAS